MTPYLPHNHNHHTHTLLLVGVLVSAGLAAFGLREILAGLLDPILRALGA